MGLDRRQFGAPPTQTVGQAQDVGGLYPSPHLKSREKGIGVAIHRRSDAFSVEGRCSDWEPDS